MQLLTFSNFSIFLSLHGRYFSMLRFLFSTPKTIFGYILSILSLETDLLLHFTEVHF